MDLRRTRAQLIPGKTPPFVVDRGDDCCFVSSLALAVGTTGNEDTMVLKGDGQNAEVGRRFEMSQRLIIDAADALAHD